MERFRQVAPELPLIVVSEFEPPEGEWIPYHILYSLEENEQRCRVRIGGRTVAIGAIVLDSEASFWPLKRIAFRLTEWGRMLVIDGALEMVRLHQRESGEIWRYARRNLADWVRAQTSPGGKAYTWMWRFAHPRELRRPFYYRLSLLAGVWLARRRRSAPAAPDPVLEAPLADGISVVIPSRDGRELLDECLPAAVAQLSDCPSEIIVVDNGSRDGTSAWLASEYPSVAVEQSQSPLSFARAVNRGIRRARFSHVCLLNNDMIVDAGFFDALRRPFDQVPDLFCATAQIFLPEGLRREETGKAVMPLRRKHDEFPLRCDVPIDGEDLSYVLYGSGGASLYDTRKLRALGSVAEVFEPAYVEDLDLGFNAWRLGWPTVFSAAARVLHRHRSTTSRYYSDLELCLTLERNYLRFLARSVTEPGLFAAMWREAIWRILLASLKQGEFVDVLRQAALSFEWSEPRPLARIPEAEVLAAGSGAIAVFPGRMAAVPRRMRVMVVSPYVPFPLSHGGAVRIFNLMRRAAKDVNQVLVCFVDELEAPPDELLDICAEVVFVQRYTTHARPSTDRPDVVEEFDSPAMRAALYQTVRKWSPGIAQLEFTQMAQYATDCAPARTILVEHDITFDLHAQLLAESEDWERRREYEKWVRFEKKAWCDVGRILTMSDTDRLLAGQNIARTLPNGVDIERFCPSPDAPERARLLFIGSFAHLPNLLALDFFLREVWPLLDRLQPALHIIAGSRPEYFLDRYKDRVAPRLDLPGVELEGFVADVRTAYRRAAVVIAPLVASAGTNIKIMEALAMGKAIVTTPAGIHGLEELEHGHDLMVAATGAEMAAEITRLIEQPDLRAEIERTARTSAVRRYDWDVIAGEQYRIYRELLSEETA